MPQFPTSLQFGPDDRLYVSTQFGDLYAYTVVRNGADDYVVTTTELINLVADGIPNHDDDGTPSTEPRRQVTGLLVGGTAQQPVLYVTSSDPRIGAGENGGDQGLDTNSGILTRLTCTSGIVGGVCQNWQEVDLLRGLPRSEENHSSNGMDLDAATNTLYLTSGGSVNMGAPSNNFAGTTEYYLSAAILSVDLGALEAMPVFTDPRNGRAFVYDLPTLDDPTRPNLAPGDPGYPYAAGHPYHDDGYLVDVGDPFGGNNGLNQAISEPGGPVQVYSPGYRNAYDVVLTESGDLYTWDNGPNTGWGGTAHIYASDGTYKGYDPALFDHGAGDYCTNEINEDGAQGHGDPLKFISDPGYYGGHQTPIRAFPGLSGVYNYIEDADGDWVHDGPPGGYSFYDLLPSWLDAADFPDNPVECAYTSLDDALDTINASTNGLAEYTASNFEGAMTGDLIAASWGGNVYRCKPDGDGGLVDLPGSGSGTTEGLCEVLFGGFAYRPLDLTAQGDGDVFAGTIWAATYGEDAVTVFEPQDFSDCDPSDPDGDADGDGYTNGDEQDNGTNPCSAANKPSDHDGDFVSDLNDPDDDNDATPDVDDPFALDPDDGTTTGLPLSYPLFADDPGTGLFGVGFTGLMLPEDGATTWLDLYDEANLAAGGTAGLFTVEEVSRGDALGAENAQDNGFLFGVDVDTGTPPFVVQVRLYPPYFAVGGTSQPPQEGQSFGFFVGTGGQDDFLRVAFNANGGVGGIEVVKETGGTATPAQYANGDWGGTDILSASSVDLLLLLDPQALTAQPRIALNGNPAVFDLGAPIDLPAGWLDPSDGRGLAVGTVSTAGPNAPLFSATWDAFDVFEAPSQARALVQVTPAGGINASTFGANSISIENLSASATITGVVFDTRTGLLPDVVFDPTGGAGDTTFKDFTPDTEGGTGQSTHAFGALHQGGYQTLEVNFDDFDPGETFRFSVDMDPTSITGTPAPGPGDSGSISGLELSGTTVTVLFSDGSTHTAPLFRGAEGAGVGASTTLGGGENLVRSPAPAQPQISVAGVALAPVPELPAHFQVATVARADPTVHVDAPVGSTVRLLVLEAALFEPAGGGSDIDPFEANSVTAVSEQTATVTDPGGVDFAVTLAPIDASSDPEATTTLNYLAAVVEDPADGMTGPLSDVAILAYDPSLVPLVLYRVNAGGGTVAAIDGEIDWEGDTEADPAPYHNLTCGGCNRTSSHDPPLSVDPSVDQATTPLSLFETERWDPSFDPEMHWSFPTGDGLFTLRLYLMNGYGGTSEPGERIFDVNVEGGVLEIDDLDLSGEYGHRHAVAFDVPVTVADGTLDIDFFHEVENPLVNAIEVLNDGGPVANRPPVLDPLPDQAHVEGDRPDLAIGAMDPDPNQNLTFSASGLPPGLDIEPTNGHVYGAIAAGAAAGSPYAVVVTVTDDGNPMLSDSGAFSWAVEEHLPTITITAPADGSTLPSADVEVSWTTGGTLLTDRVHLVLDGDGANAITGLPLDGSHTLPALADGPHTVTAQVAALAESVYTNPEATDEVAFTVDTSLSGAPSALLLINPGGPFGISTFTNNSFRLSNTGDVDITSVSLDISTAYFPDIIFDPSGTGGDTTAKCLTPNDTVGDPGFVVPADPCVDPFSQPHDADGDGTGDPDDGYDVITLDFTDFNGGEQFNFSVDQDPNSIKGDDTAGDAGSISGFENIGGTLTVTFANGAVVTTNVWEQGSNGGGEAVVLGTPAPAAPTLGTPVPLTPLDGDRAGAAVSSPDQTLTLTGPPDAPYTLLQVDGRLYIDKGGGGYDIDPFEANEAVAKVLYTGTLDGSGAASVPVTLLQTPGSGGAPDAGLNYFIAVIDGQDGQTSATSNVIVLELADTVSFAVMYEEGWRLVSLPVGVADPDYLVVFDPASGGDPDNAQNVVPGTLFEFDGTYSTPDPPDLTVGVGAWLLFAQASNLTLEGVAVPMTDRAIARDGWYLFGGPSCTLPVSALEGHPDIVDGTVYGFDGMYVTPTALEPGQSYWARVADGASPTTITLDCGTATRPDPPALAAAAGDGLRAPSPVAGRRAGTAGRAASADQAARAEASESAGRADRRRPAGARAHAVTPDPDLTAFGAVTVADADGRARTLRLGATLPGGAESDRFGLPPVPPPGAFDARFDGDTRLSEGAEALVRVQASAFPLRIEADRLPNGAEAYDLDVLAAGKVVATHRLERNRPVEVAATDLQAPDGLTLHLRPAAVEALPAAFALVGAYPNPTRREATVAFDLPEAADIRLEVYDLLGRRVVVVEEPSVEPGAARTLRLRAEGLASGTYLLRLEARLSSGTASATSRLTIFR